MKQITKLLAVFWLFSMCLYTSIQLGTLAHELVHAQNGKVETISIYFDGSGEARGQFLEHSHEYVYLQGSIVLAALLSISAFSIIIITKEGR